MDVEEKATSLFNTLSNNRKKKLFIRKFYRILQLFLTHKKKENILILALSSDN